MIEIEFKFPINPESVERLQTKLQSLQREYSQQESDQGEKEPQGHVESDEYFNHKLLAFDKADIALRIRRVENRFTLTYKGPGLDDQAKVRDEIEIEMSQADANKIKSILSGIGMYSVATVNKTRQTSHLNWDGTEIAICFDEVDKVGSFVELEIIVENESEIQAAKSKLAALAQTLDLQKSTKTSYLELLLEKENSPEGNVGHN